MKYFGAHVSAAGGVENAPANAHAIGAEGGARGSNNPPPGGGPPASGARRRSWPVSSGPYRLPRGLPLPRHSVAAPVRRRLSAAALPFFQFPFQIAHRRHHAVDDRFVPVTCQ